MDPETRRNVWDALQDVAKKRTLLLSSHDMEEADALADQIVMMASGTVICCGSTAFLKKACGVGYKVTLTKVTHAFDLKSVMSIIHKTTPEAVVDDDKLEEVSIALGTLEHHHFPEMFKALESSVEQLGIAGIGVTVASMKDVYLKINMDWAPGGKEREKPVEGTYEEARRKLDRFRLSSDVSMSEDDEPRKRKRARPASLESSSEAEADDLPDAPLELTEPSNSGQPENRTNVLSYADFQKRILTTMSIIRHTQTEIIDMLSTLMVTSEKPAESCTPEVLAEPLESVEAVKAFDATLTDGKHEALMP
ncbi:hypothetical protein MTO96_035774 [Rhipicephalus appendiculatus]